MELPSSHILLPYINPDKNFLHGQIDNGQRYKDKPLIVINVHDNMHGAEIVSIYDHCNDTSECVIQKIEGFDNQGLVELYNKAMIVVAFCMNGSERCPIEAVLGGAVLISNNCNTAKDIRDFPIPRGNVVTSKNTAPKVIQVSVLNSFYCEIHTVQGKSNCITRQRIIQNFEYEQKQMEGMRQMYQSYGPASLQRQTKDFIFAL